MTLETNKDAWGLIEFWLNENPPDSSHIRAYENFLTKIPKLLTFQIVYKDFTFGIKDPKFLPPSVKQDGKTTKILPSSCIENKSSYDSEVLVTFYFKWKDETIKEEENITIGLIPVMVGSSLCNLNHPKPSQKAHLALEFKTGLGGWFVKEGTSRVITFQERNKFNHPMIFNLTEKISKNKTTLFTVEVRNSVSDECTTGIVAISLDKNSTAWCSMKYVDDKKEVAPLLFFYALGYDDPKQIISFIISENDPLFKLEYTKLFLQKLFEQAKQYNYVEEISSLGMQGVQNKEEYIEQLLTKKFLHHYSSKRKKATYFGYIIYCLISISVPEDIKRLHPEIKFVQEDDRDHFGKKVLDTESSLFSNVFYSAVSKMRDTIDKNIQTALKDKSDEMMLSIVRDMNAKMLFPESDITKMPITAMLSKALTTNMWGKSKRDGVSTVFDPINYNNAVILLLKSCIRLQTFVSNLEPRMVHGSFFGFIDLFDTPEGEKIGHNKVLSSSAYVSSEIDITNVIGYIEKNCILLGKSTCDISLKKIFIDNEWIGVATKEKCIELCDNLYQMKLGGQIDPTISMVWNSVKEELHIFSQEGRLLRPFLVVEDGKILYKKTDKYPTWSDLCGSGKVVMLDNNEFEFVRKYCVSIDEFYKLSEKDRKRITHLEIHPVLILVSWFRSDHFTAYGSGLT